MQYFSVPPLSSAKATKSMSGTGPVAFSAVPVATPLPLSASAGRPSFSSTGGTARTATSALAVRAIITVGPRKSSRSFTDRTGRSSIW